MSNAKTLRIRINPNSLVKIAVIVSNSVMLTANAYLIGSGFRNHYRVRQQERISNVWRYEKLPIAGDFMSSYTKRVEVM